MTGADTATSRVPRLAVRELTVELGGRTILDGVSLEVPAGAIVGLIGPNGAGKTTLLDAICGFTDVAAGTMLLDGAPLNPHAQRLIELGIGRTLQTPGSFDGDTVLDHVMRGAAERAPRQQSGLRRLRRLAEQRRHDPGLRDHAIGLLRELDLTEFADTEAAPLPHAVRARAELARTLVTAPRLLLLDEPAAALGLADATALARTIAGLRGRRRREESVLLIEHRIPLILEVCDLIVVLDEGRVIAQGTPTQLLANDEVAAAHLGVEAGDGDP